MGMVERGGNVRVFHVDNRRKQALQANIRQENFWSLLKRGLHGTYISVEPYHLFRYLDEQAFRYNNRELTDPERFTIAMKRIVGRRLTYAQLTAGTVAHG